MNNDQTTKLRMAMLNMNHLAGNMLFLTEEIYKSLSRFNSNGGSAVFSACWSEYEEIDKLLREACARTRRFQKLCGFTAKGSNA